jgi:hypothetical protein
MSQPGKRRPPVVVWGNCQAAPLAALITGPLAEHGWDVQAVPPVFEVDAAGLAEVQDLLSRAALLVTQRIRDEYSIPGCGSDQLTALLPPTARVITIPVTYDTSAFPYQVNAHAGDGTRVDAPLTDYHDLRAIVAAERGLDVEDAVAWWPAPTADAVRSNAEASRAELGRREAELDVTVSDLLVDPVMFTLSHPANVVLAEVARRILRVLDLPADVVVPERQFLGDRRAPVEESVVNALGWDEEARRDGWQVLGRAVDQHELLTAQLAFYADGPDIVADARVRFAARLELLGL